MIDRIDIKTPKIGRPSALTPAIIDKLNTAFSIGCNISSACLYAGIHTSSLYRYLEKHPEYKDEISQLQDGIILKAQAELFKGLEQKPELALKVLEKLRDKYKQKQDVKVSIDSFEKKLEALKQAQRDREKDGGDDEIS